jgi:hypothetical protein
MASYTVRYRVQSPITENIVDAETRDDAITQTIVSLGPDARLSVLSSEPTIEELPPPEPDPEPEATLHRNTRQKK